MADLHAFAANVSMSPMCPMLHLVRRSAFGGGSMVRCNERPLTVFLRRNADHYHRLRFHQIVLNRLELQIFFPKISIVRALLEVPMMRESFGSTAQRTGLDQR